VLFPKSMKTIVLTSLLVASLATAAAANPVIATAQDVRESDHSIRDLEREETLAFLALKDARQHVAATRARWDAAVADEHPGLAGKWARRHLEAMQVRNAAVARWQAAVVRVNASRYASIQ